MQTIKNSLNDNELMLELMSANQAYIFSGSKRKSLMLQQNAGLRGVFSSQETQADLDDKATPSIFSHEVQSPMTFETAMSKRNRLLAEKSGSVRKTPLSTSNY